MTVVHEVVKFRAKVLRVVFSELTENDAEPLALIDCDAGEILMFVGDEVVIVPAVFEVNTTVPVVPPFFFMENEEGLTINLQPPEPFPVTGGPGVPPTVESQSSELSCGLVPVTAVLEETPEVAVTDA